MEKFYVVRNSGQAVFVKAADFFEQQKRESEPDATWWKRWTSLWAPSIEMARALGETILPLYGSNEVAQNWPFEVPLSQLVDKSDEMWINGYEAQVRFAVDDLLVCDTQIGGFNFHDQIVKLDEHDGTAIATDTEGKVWALQFSRRFAVTPGDF